LLTLKFNSCRYNEASSRSHTIFTLSVELRGRDWPAVHFIRLDSSAWFISYYTDD
jgi:hypothetical protein